MLSAEEARALLVRARAGREYWREASKGVRRNFSSQPAKTRAAGSDGYAPWQLLVKRGSQGGHT